MKADLLKRDFLYLLKRLTINPEALPMMIRALEHYNSQNRPEDQVPAIQAEIAHWRQHEKNADLLFTKARLGEADWQKL